MPNFSNMELRESQNDSLPIPLTASSVPSESAPSKSVDDGTPPAEAAHNVLAVYVARFDVLQGNTIEWQYPNEIDLSGIEYKAISSGLHRVPSDVIYFSHETNVGVSVFRNVASNEIDRGACMRAIGAVVEPTSATGASGSIWAHGQQLKHLANQFRFDYNGSEEAPYKALQKYYQQHRIQHRPDENNIQWTLDKDIPRLTDVYAPTHHPHTLFHSLASFQHERYLEAVPFRESFPFFVAAMGPQVFVLWKAALLRKRILYLTSPPLQNTCSHVYSTSLLATAPPSRQSERSIQTIYAVTVNDIMDLIEFRVGYIACTSDSIFESKTELFDILVKEPEKNEIQHRIESNTPEIASRHNAADFARFRSMVRQIFDAAAVDGFLENDPDLEGRFVECLERKADMLDAFATPYWQLILWWYRPRPVSSSTTVPSSWQRMFAGARRAQRGSNKSQDISMDAEEQDVMLGGSADGGERDAHEINNNDVFDAVVARASAEYESSSPPPARSNACSSPSQSQQTMDINEKLTRALINFFQVLSMQVLSGLETILSANEALETDAIDLSPQDMIKLGLHPHGDADFVVGLAAMYFKKMVRVRKPCSLCESSPCCGSHTEGAIRIDQE